MRWFTVVNVVPVDPIVERLSQLETVMSAQSEAFDNLTTAIAGVAGDVAYLRELLDAALATNPDQSAEIERLRAEADEVVAKVTAATAAIDAIEPPAAELG